MRWIITNLVTAFWACLLGLVLTYIASQLEQLTPNYGVGAVISIVVALIASNSINAINKMSSPKENAKIKHDEN